MNELGRDGIKLNPSSREKKLSARAWAVLIAIGMLWLLAISNRSLWLDEAHGAGWKARQATLTEWWQDDIAQPGSTDSQIAGYVLYIWAAAKMVGSSEWTLRALNFPWVWLGFLAWFKSFAPQKKMRWGMALVAAVSPFLWYYLDEARPYAMQVGGGFLIAAAIQRLYADNGNPQILLVMFAFGLVALSASNLLGEIWAGAAVATAGFVLGWKKCWQLMRAYSWLCGFTLMLLVGFGSYYLWTLKSGSRATLVGRTDVQNLFFVFYELFGFGGLGPGRLDIRGQGLGAFYPFVGWLAVYGLALMPIIVAGIKQASQVVPRRILFFTILSFGSAALVLVGEGYLSPFRILGRHFTPLLVLEFYLLGLGVNRLWTSGWWQARVWVFLFATVSLVSGLELRFAHRHWKDNYRDAAKMARNVLHAGQHIWWNADQRGAGYYQVATDTTDAAMARYLMNPTPDELRRARSPDWVFASKPDVYDANDALAEYLHTHHYQVMTNLTAFTIWCRAGEIRLRD